MFPSLVSEAILQNVHKIRVMGNITCVFSRAVVKSTFVKSKTSPRPGLSSPNQDRVQRGSSPSPSPNETVKTEKEIKNLLQNHILNYSLCDTRDSISSIVR